MGMRYPRGSDMNVVGSVLVAYFSKMRYPLKSLALNGLRQSGSLFLIKYLFYYEYINIHI